MILAVSRMKSGRTMIIVGLEASNLDLIVRGQPAWVEGDVVAERVPHARDVALRDVDVVIGCGTEADIRRQLGQNAKEPPVVDRLSDLKGILQNVLEQHGDVDGNHLENAISELGRAADEFEEAGNG